MNTSQHRFLNFFAKAKTLPWLAVLAALLAFTPTSHAIQWKWLDAQGKVQYSDRPPPSDVPDKSILKRPAKNASLSKPLPATDAPTSSPSKPLAPTVDAELEKKKRQADEADASKRKADEEKQAQTRADNCQRARKYEKALDQGYRFTRPNDKGEREVLDEKGIAEEKARAKSVIASDCR